MQIKDRKFVYVNFFLYLCTLNWIGSHKKMRSSTDIEKKALNHLKLFIEDSSMISPFIREDDKEPIWDGFLYLYTDGIKDNKHLYDRVAVQVKGKVVKQIKSEKFRFPIERDELEAYLKDPVVYIVCQIKDNPRERKLFYRCLLPMNIKNILRGKDKQKEISVSMKPMPDSCEEFENILTIFASDRQKQFSFAQAKSLTMEEVRRRGIIEFQLSAPIKPMSGIEALQYISSHESFLYAKIDPALDITVPIDMGGEGHFSFNRTSQVEIKVGDRVFFDHIESTIENGLIKFNADDMLTFELKSLNELYGHHSFQVHSRADKLDERIKEYEFILALCHEKSITVGTVTLDVNVEAFGDVEQIEKQFQYWCDIQKLLQRLHVTKPLLLSQIRQEEHHQLALLIDAIVYGRIVVYPAADTSLHIFKIGNLRILVWTSADKSKTKCEIGDFFDNRIEIGYREGDEMIIVSPFSYLRNNLWGTIDNIPFDQQLDSMKGLPTSKEHVYKLANADVLAMMSCADKIHDKDIKRYDALLQNAMMINEWLETEESGHVEKIIHRMNQIQIIKRQRELNEDEKDWLHVLYKDKALDSPIKLCISALLDDKRAFMKYKSRMTIKDFAYYKKQPIAKFFPK